MTVQELGLATWQLGLQVSLVGPEATIRSTSIGFGGDYARLRTDCRMLGRGATGELDAVYFGEGSQTLDFRTFQDHVAPDCTSNLLFKGAVGGRSRSVYTGMIRVGKEARGTNAFQTNRNVKLSEGAWAESVPNLVIENNDVRCSHASAVGPVDEDQRFYLESRGVPTEEAERLIVAGFFDEVLNRLPVAAVVPLLRAHDRRQVRPEGRLMAKVPLCPLDELAPGTARHFDVGRHRLAVVRLDDDVYALHDVCSHQEVPLSEGEVDPDERTIECWKHGSLFDLVTGEPLSLPATRPVPVYDVRVDDGMIVVVLPDE